MKHVVADKELWLTGDGKTVVEAGDPQARSCLVKIGDQLSPRAQKQFGIAKKKGKFDKLDGYDPSFEPREGDCDDLPDRLK